MRNGKVRHNQGLKADLTHRLAYLVAYPIVHRRRGLHPKREFKSPDITMRYSTITQEEHNDVFLDLNL